MFKVSEIDKPPDPVITTWTFMPVYFSSISSKIFKIVFLTSEWCLVYCEYKQWSFSSVKYALIVVDPTSIPK